MVLTMVILTWAGPAMFGLTFTYVLPAAPSASPKDNPAYVYWEKLSNDRNTYLAILFHTFIMMQIFNLVNCRKLGIKEYNIFERFTNNWLFLAILAGIFAL